MPLHIIISLHMVYVCVSAGAGSGVDVVWEAVRCALIRRPVDILDSAHAVRRARVLYTTKGGHSTGMPFCSMLRCVVLCFGEHCYKLYIFKGLTGF